MSSPFEEGISAQTSPDEGLLFTVLVSLIHTVHFRQVLGRAYGGYSDDLAASQYSNELIYVQYLPNIFPMDHQAAGKSRPGVG